MSNRKWNLGLLLLFAVFACLLLQFVFSTLRIRELVRPLESGPPDGDRPRHIVLIPQELDNPYWRSIEQGAREAARQYGMELDYTGPFRINPTEQSRLLEKAIAAKADAILLQGIGDPQYRGLIDKAAGRGIPVIAVDMDEPESRRLAYVGTDNTEAGKRMGELVAQTSGGSGTIGVLIGSEAPNQRLRLEGFRSVIGRYPKLKIAEVRSSNISRLQAAEQAAAILSAQPQTGYLVGFSALDGPGMLEAAGRVRPQGLRIFAFDDLPETKEGIRQCKLAATIVQQPRQMGFDAVALLHDYFQGKTPQPQHYTATSVLDRSALEIGGSCP
ncbi:substrate-binding domain-containing protein [Paenibacillus elgii]|uniref:substrate-binding domain-containing protein n=1 Tax=Paenibacillus elgii TaxID=189691 RepID=UPI00203F067A|nr:substrate-binding domain-containing protein [Paenibacillus elgii]MCM3268525.1 substrate-binding domain-containing protein [Paenibacillus elgii]